MVTHSVLLPISLVVWLIEVFTADSPGESLGHSAINGINMPRYAWILRAGVLISTLSPGEPSSETDFIGSVISTPVARRGMCSLLWLSFVRVELRWVVHSESYRSLVCLMRLFI